MSAGLYNLLIEKGTDFIKTFTLRDKISKDPIDLLGANFEFKIAAKEGGVTVLSIPITIADPSTGVFSAFLEEADVNLITLKEGYFTLNVTWSNNITERLMEGRVVISKGVV